eukprot:608847-Hanusia_phi.AAC.1
MQGGRRRSGSGEGRERNGETREEGGNGEIKNKFESEPSSPHFFKRPPRNLLQARLIVLSDSGPESRRRAARAAGPLLRARTQASPGSTVTVPF